MKKSQVRKNQSFWISPASRLLMKQRDEIRDIARQSQRKEDWDRYKILRNKCTLETKKDKVRHFKKIYEEAENNNDMKTVYNTTKQQLGWKTGGPPELFLMERKTVSAPSDIANVQSDYYEKKVKDINEILPLNQ